MGMNRYVARDFIARAQNLINSHAGICPYQPTCSNLALRFPEDQQPGGKTKVKLVRVPAGAGAAGGAIGGAALPYFGKVVDEFAARFTSKATSLHIGAGLVLDGSGLLDVTRTDCCVPFLIPPLPKAAAAAADAGPAKKNEEVGPNGGSHRHTSRHF